MQTTMRHNRVCTHKQPSELADNERRLWISRKEAFLPLSNESRVTWILLSQFDCSQARPTTLLLQMSTWTRLVQTAEETAETSGTKTSFALSKMVLCSSGTDCVLRVTTSQQVDKQADRQVVRLTIICNRPFKSDPLWLPSPKIMLSKNFNRALRLTSTLEAIVVQALELTSNGHHTRPQVEHSSSRMLLD